MDSLVLIERLDELMAEAKPIPLTHEARVDRDEVYKILDRLRTTLPVEFERVRSMGKETAQEEGLEDKLHEINEAVAEMRRLQRAQAESANGTPLTVAAAQQVREIIEAAERAAANIEKEANAEAARVREEAAAHLRHAKAEAERHLHETRQRAAAEAADYLRRVEDATTKMLERAASAGSEIDGMLTRLRGSGGSVIEELEAIMSGLEEIRVRRNTPAARSVRKDPGAKRRAASGPRPEASRPRRPIEVEPAPRAERAPASPMPRADRSERPERPEHLERSERPEAGSVVATRPRPEGDEPSSSTEASADEPSERSNVASGRPVRTDLRPAPVPDLAEPPQADFADGLSADRPRSEPSDGPSAA